MPGGTSSNIFTYFSGSDVTLSLVATGVSNILATVMLPILVPFYGSFYTEPEGAIPFESIIGSVVLVLVPCTIGIIVKRNSDGGAKCLEKFAGGMGALSIFVNIVAGSYENFDMFFEDWKLYPAALLMMPTGGIVGYNMAKLVGLPQKTCQACSFESGLQNALIGLNILRLAYEESNCQIFREASVFCYLYLFMIFIPHGPAMTAYFRSLPQPEPEQEANELAEAALQA